MDIQDGFIVGIFNYCDRWCERCALTSYCGLFADRAEMEASLDPNLKAIAEAPPLPEEMPPPPPMWMQELLAEMNEACNEPVSPDEWERIRPRVRREDKPIDERAKDYAARTHAWLAASAAAAAAQGDARDVISWFHFMVATKIRRALTYWPDEETGAQDEKDSDSNGSAKVALLAIERSHAAWLELVERDTITPAEAEPFIADLVWLGDVLERVRPNARAFIRPAFDEPLALAKCLGTAERR